MKILNLHLDDKLYFRIKNGNYSINELIALAFTTIDWMRAYGLTSAPAKKEKPKEEDKDADIM